MLQHCFFVLFHTSYLRYRSSHQGCSMKNSVLRNFTKLTGKHLCQSLFFNKVVGLRPATLLKKRLRHRCFLVNFAKFLRTPFLHNTGRLLLEIQITGVENSRHKSGFLYTLTVYKPNKKCLWVCISPRLTFGVLWYIVCLIYTLFNTCHQTYLDLIEVIFRRCSLKEVFLKEYSEETLYIFWKSPYRKN